MDELRKGVLKGDAIRMGDPFSIPAPRSGSTGGVAAGSGPTARIAQQNDTHALVEVICSCGQTIQVQCNYSEPPK